LDATTMLDTTELDTAAVAASGALVNGPEDEPLDWDAIQWRHAEENVRRLRQRIFAASTRSSLPAAPPCRGICPAPAETCAVSIWQWST
jgi:hypothetical protein